MLIRIVKRPRPNTDLARLEAAARAEIARVLGPEFRFPAPPPPTTEFRIYLWTQDAWWVVLPVIGYVDVWAVDLVGEVVPDQALRQQLLDGAESEFKKLGERAVDDLDVVH